jgi:precorrin-3B C17-methyltransferase
VSGRLAVIGLGPGDARYLTAEAQTALAEAEAVYGYGSYLDRVPPRAGQSRHASDNRQEATRAREALAQAANGAKVALVSGGDPGVFAMAAAVCEEIASGPPAWRALDLAIVPGVTAMLAVAARVGAPLGHDFCVLSLSDNLKPWELIERRLEAAAKAGFVIALYNPSARARPWQLGKTFERLRALLPPATAVVFGRAIGRADENVAVTTLAAAVPDKADMATLIIIGSTETHLIERPGRAPLVYTSRAAEGACP